MTPPSTAEPLAWTIGAGGLIGSAVDARQTRRFHGSSIPWADSYSAVRTIASDAERFADETAGGPWRIVWAAGHATVATAAEYGSAELRVLREAFTAIAGRLPSGAGAVCLVSSAGGIYSGGIDSPFSEGSPPTPAGAYGQLKLDQEHVARESLEGRAPLVLARVSNAYGPGQDLGKLQGLISRLVVAAATRQPINIFVPLSTIRDYIYVDDAAAQIDYWTGLAHTQRDVQVKVIASGEPVVLASLLKLTQSVTGRRIPVALGSHPSAIQQSLDLRFLPSERLDGRAFHRTGLPIGIRRVYDDVLQRLQSTAGI